jgi:hypothetical protein
MWLSACPAESEQPGTEINYFQKQQFTKKACYKIFEVKQ